MKTLLTFAAALIMYGCSEYQQNIYYNMARDSVQLAEHHESIIRLDSVTPYYSSCIEYQQSDSSDIHTLWMLNKSTGLINMFFFGPDTIIYNKSIDLTKFLPQDAAAIDGFKFITQDSFIVVSQQTLKLSIINSKTNLTRTISLEPNFKNNLFSNPQASTTNPIIIENGLIMIGGFLGNKVDIGKSLPIDLNNLNLQIDLTHNKIAATLSYPEIYNGKLWGGNMLSYYRCYNEDLALMAYSFPADHEVCIVDNGILKLKHPAGSRFFDRVLSLKSSDLDYASRERYFLTTPSYGPIYYDKYRKVYYRFAYQAVPQEDLIANDPSRNSIKHASIIILDQRLRKIGETLLPRFDYTETMSFISPQGFHIAKWSKSKLDENYLVFGCFKLIAQ